MPAVELTDRKQIESRRKESEPCCDADGMEIDFHAGRRSLSHQRCDRLEDQRLSKLDGRTGWRSCNISGFCKCNGQGWNSEDEANDWPRNSNLEQCRAMLNRRLDADEGSHRSHGRPGYRDEIRQRCVNAIIAARQVVSHLMTEEN